MISTRCIPRYVVFMPISYNKFWVVSKSCARTRQNVTFLLKKIFQTYCITLRTSLVSNIPNKPWFIQQSWKNYVLWVLLKPIDPSSLETFCCEIYFCLLLLKRVFFSLPPFDLIRKYVLKVILDFEHEKHVYIMFHFKDIKLLPYFAKKIKFQVKFTQVSKQK